MAKLSKLSKLSLYGHKKFHALGPIFMFIGFLGLSIFLVASMYTLEEYRVTITACYVVAIISLMVSKRFSRPVFSILPYERKIEIREGLEKAFFRFDVIKEVSLSDSEIMITNKKNNPICRINSKYFANYNLGEIKKTIDNIVRDSTVEKDSLGNFVVREYTSFIFNSLPISTMSIVMLALAILFFVQFFSYRIAEIIT